MQMIFCVFCDVDLQVSLTAFFASTSSRMTFAQQPKLFIGSFGNSKRPKAYSNELHEVRSNSSDLTQAHYETNTIDSRNIKTEPSNKSAEARRRREKNHTLTYTEELR